MLNIRANVVLLLVCSTFAPALCRGQEVHSGEPETKFVAYCSTTQVADFVRQVVGDRWEVRCVLAPGQDPHLYRHKPNDIRAVREADLCFENGLHLEGADWMQQLAKSADKRVVTCTDGLTPLVIKEDDGERTVNDPHAWFTPMNATIYLRNILNAVSEFDPEHKDEYESRADLYRSQLRTLDTWIKKQFNVIPPSRRVLVTSHDAFNYFCEAYGFKSAAPVGWSTGQEIGSDVTIARRRAAIESIRESGVKAIFVETSVNKDLIFEIAKEAGVKVGRPLYSDSMGEAGSAGETYIGMMRENVLTIIEALR